MELVCGIGLPLFIAWAFWWETANDDTRDKILAVVAAALTVLFCLSLVVLIVVSWWRLLT